MCGIAGYSLRSRSRVERTLAAQALLAGIAERGADAVGYAYRAPGEAYPTVVKQRTPASELIERISVPQAAHPGEHPPRPPGAGRRDPQRDHRQRRRAARRLRLRTLRAADDGGLRSD